MNSAAVLVVEDESLVAMALEMMLRDLGHHVTGICATGTAALEAVRARRPDLVMMDIILRGEPDGIETARRLREICDLRVVFISGQSDRATRARADAVEPLGYLTKPYSPVELRAVVDAALAAVKPP